MSTFLISIDHQEVTMVIIFQPQLFKCYAGFRKSETFWYKHKIYSQDQQEPYNDYQMDFQQGRISRLPVVCNIKTLDPVAATMVLWLFLQKRLGIHALQKNVAAAKCNKQLCNFTTCQDKPSTRICTLNPAWYIYISPTHCSRRTSSFC